MPKEIVDEPKKDAPAPTEPTPDPAVPQKVEQIADQVENDEIDITEAVVKSYKMGLADAKETQAPKSEPTPDITTASRTKDCWYCGEENNCIYCRAKK